MIRRSPTRIELKLEDLNDFEYIQKFDKKKNATGAAAPTPDGQKLIRQERVGLGQGGFRPIRSSSNIGSSNSAVAGSQQGSSIASPPVVGTPAGNGGAIVSAGVTPTTPSINDTPVDMNVTNNNSANDALNLIPEEDGIQANNSTMSFDESL